MHGLCGLLAAMAAHSLDNQDNAVQDIVQLRVPQLAHLMDDALAAVTVPPSWKHGLRVRIFTGSNCAPQERHGAQRSGTQWHSMGLMSLDSRAPPPFPTSPPQKGSVLPSMTGSNCTRERRGAREERTQVRVQVTARV